MKLVLRVNLLLMLLSLISCGGAKSGGGSVSSINSALSAPYKYFVYVANATDNTISTYSMNRETGVLSAIETTSAGTGGTPYLLNINKSADKLYLSKGADGQDSNLQIFNINKLTGILTPFQNLRIVNSGQLPATQQLVTSVSLSNDGKFAYVSLYGGDLNVYSISTYTGFLTLLRSYGVSAPVNRSFLHPNGDILFWVTNGGVLMLPVNKNTGEVTLTGNIATIPATNGDSVALSVDGTKLYLPFSSGVYGFISQFNLDLSSKTGTHIQDYMLGTFTNGVAVSNFGKLLIGTDPRANMIHSFLINESTGALVKVNSQPTDIYPTKVEFFPDGKYALEINKGSKSISSYLVEESTGNMKLVGSVSTGVDPQNFIIVKISN